VALPWQDGVDLVDHCRVSPGALGGLGRLVFQDQHELTDYQAAGQLVLEDPVLPHDRPDVVDRVMLVLRRAASTRSFRCSFCIISVHGPPGGGRWCRSDVTHRASPSGVTLYMWMRLVQILHPVGVSVRQSVHPGHVLDEAGQGHPRCPASPLPLGIVQPLPHKVGDHDAFGLVEVGGITRLLNSFIVDPLMMLGGI